MQWLTALFLRGPFLPPVRMGRVDKGSPSYTFGYFAGSAGPSFHIPADPRPGVPGISEAFRPEICSPKARLEKEFR